MVSAPIKDAERLGLPTVLNALRHQWFRHTQSGNLRHRILGVLNALRHQWFRHDDLSVVQAIGMVVLNALRHQWFRHSWLFGTDWS